MKKYLPIILLLVIMITGFNTQTYAQNVRKVLVEEGTNTSCGPCASQNPSYQQWITNNISRLAPVVYHSWWPGPTDPMYVYDTSMQANRIRYYGIQSIGVPCGVLNGLFNTATGTWYAGAVGDTGAYSASLAKVPFYSPIGIKIDFTNTNGSGKVKVDVTTGADFSNKTLKIVICEKHHYYANMPNKETDFYYLAKKMLPDYKGEVISLKAGDTKSVSYDYSIGTDYADGLYAVAFIQDDMTKEVIQAEETLGNPPPTPPEYAVFVNKFEMVFIGDENETSSVETILLNNTSTDATFSINAFKSTSTPKDWKSELKDNTYTVTVPANSKKTVTASLTIGSTVSTGEMIFNAQIQGSSQNVSFNYLGISSKIQRFYVLSGVSGNATKPIIENVRGTGVIFDIKPEYVGMALPKMTNLKTIIWDGSTDGTISSTDALALRDAINNGTGVLISGGNMASGVVNSGLASFLGANYIAHCKEGYGQSPWPVTLAGVNNDIISSTFGKSVQGNLINWLIPLFKITDPQNTKAVMTFAKSSDSIIAIRAFKPKARAVYLGFNPYILKSTAIRDTLINRSLDWIESRLAEGVEIFDNTTDAYISPNPVEDIATINFGKTNTEPTTISLFNLLGEQLMSFSTQNSNSYDLNLSGLIAGNYYVVIRSGGKTTTLTLQKQ